MRALPLCLLLACVPHINEPGPLSPASLPPPPEPPALSVCWLEFATGNLPHGMVVAHRKLDHDVVSTQSGLLLIHPQGTWLIDGGMALDPQPALDELRGPMKLFIGQAAKGWTRVASAQQALEAAGVAPSSLSGLIPTHGHFDHLGGLLDLDGVPVVLPAQEIAMAARVAAGGEGSILPSEARALSGRSKALSWDDGPAMYWDRSRDLFGDGSVVLVPLSGHTPGSLGARVRLADGRELFLVGDTVWVREGYEQRESRSWLASNFDADFEQNSTQVARLWALHQAEPALNIVPAHDRRQWEAVFGAPGCVSP